MTLPILISMAEIHIKKSKELKNIGGHKPFGIDLDPDNDLCLAKDKDAGQLAYYKGKPMKYLDYWGEICTRGEKNKKGKNLNLSTFAGYGSGTLKKPYREIDKNGS